MNGFVKAGITEKTTTIEIAAEDESVTEDIASDTETLPDELIHRQVISSMETVSHRNQNPIY